MWYNIIDLGIGKTVEVAFLLDSSNSISKIGFGNIKDFIMASLSSLDVSPFKTRVSIVQFGSKPSTVINFLDGKNNEVIKPALENAHKLNGRRDLKKALEYVYSNVFSSVSGSRKKSQKVLVIVTGNEVNAMKYTDITESAMKLKDQDIDIVVVGLNLDKAVTNALLVPDDSVTTLTDFAKLPEYLGDIEKDIGKSGRIYMFLSSYYLNLSQQLKKLNFMTREIL